MSDTPRTPLQWAIRFHEVYERLAPSYGYETRADTRALEPGSPNGRLMIAVMGEMLQLFRATIRAEKAEAESPDVAGLVGRVADAKKLASNGTWMHGVAGSANLVAFDGCDVVGIAAIAEHNANYILACIGAADFLLSQQAQIDRLKAELSETRLAAADNILEVGERLKKAEAELAAAARTIGQLNSGRSKAEAERDALKVDAERVDALERLSRDDNMPYRSDGEWHVWLGTPTQEHKFPTVRAAIDAAREEPK